MATTPKYFSKSFAEDVPANRTTVPLASGGSGDVSYEDGYGINYEQDQSGGAPALDIERTKMNELFFQLSNFAKASFEEGILVYIATVEYEIGALAQGSNSSIYQAIALNGPATSVVDPVDDLAQTTWRLLKTDIADYSATVNYLPDEYVKGTDGLLYVCLIANGPDATPVTDPVSDLTGRWITYRTDVWTYSTTFNYAVDDYVKGTDGFLYVCAIINGPATTPVVPVGDLTGTWLLLAGGGAGVVTTVISISDPAFAPNAATQSMKITVTGAGGGGGGIRISAATTSGCSSGGAGGGTAISWLTAPFSASYAVVIGAGGAGGAPPAAGGQVGAAGGVSTFDAATLNYTGNGGAGGTFVTNVGSGSGVTGGTAANGEINLSGSGTSGYADLGTLGGSWSGYGGGSYWGGAAGSVSGGGGVSALAAGAGGGGVERGNFNGLYTGGAGADGLVVIEEYF